MVEVETTAISYLQKAEAGILLKSKRNEYHGQGRDHEGSGIRERQPPKQVRIRSDENCLKGACEIEFEQFLMSAVMSFALVSFFCMTCLWVLSAETIVIYLVVV